MDVTDEFMINLLQEGPIGVGLASEGMQFYQSGVFECA